MCEWSVISSGCVGECGASGNSSVCEENVAERDGWSELKPCEE